MRILAVCITAAVVATAQPSIGVFEHIQPNLNANGQDPYPGCPSGPGADPSCIGQIEVWHQGGEYDDE